MKIIGKINLQKVNIVDYDTVFAYSEVGQSPQLYMRVDLQDEFFKALKPLIAPEGEMIPSSVVVFNLQNGRLKIIPKTTMVMTYPTATINLTEDNCPDNS
jgi:hypothetical protein